MPVQEWNHNLTDKNEGRASRAKSAVEVFMRANTENSSGVHDDGTQSEVAEDTKAEDDLLDKETPRDLEKDVTFIHQEM